MYKRKVDWENLADKSRFIHPWIHVHVSPLDSYSFSLYISIHTYMNIHQANHLLYNILEDGMGKGDKKCFDLVIGILLYSLEMPRGFIRS